MDIITHFFIFAGAIAAIWFFAGLVVTSIDRVAHRFHNSGFIVAFFLLGFLTSISEISVALNSVLEGVPQVSVGNLVGASFVLLLFVVPFLVISAGKIKMNKIFSGWRLVFVLFIIGLPVLFLIDGSLSKREGIAVLLFLVSLLWVIKKQGVPSIAEREVRKENKRLPFFDIGKVAVAAVVIFLAGNLLVTEAVYFATVLNAPQSLIGLILLSVGTNIPEIAIAVRAVRKNRSEVALGNYLGSAVVNTAIFGLVGVVSGPFIVDQSEFFISALFIIVGLTLFYIFIRSKDALSRKEGVILLVVYALFLIFHVYTLVRGTV
ncbi:MAG: sodium:calcium antiporter [Minisyncoccia bacterium]